MWTSFKTLVSKNIATSIWITINLHIKIMPFSYHMEWKAFIEASYINDIHTWERFILQLLLLKACETFLFRQSNKSYVYFVLYESSLYFSRKQDQIDTGYWKKILFPIYRFLVGCVKVWIYFQEEQFRMLIGFLPIFVTDTKIIYGYNFVAPLKACTKKTKTSKFYSEISYFLQLSFFSNLRAKS